MVTQARPFLIAAIPFGLYVVAIIVWLELGIGGRTVTTALSDIGQALAALAAAGSCGYASIRSTARQRLAWGLLAASAAAWAAGQVGTSVYEVCFGIHVPLPSAVDIGYVAAIPLAATGVLAFPVDPRKALGRALLDGAAFALSLLFVSWAVDLGQIYHHSHASWLAQAVGLAYPLGDFAVLTVLFVAFRRSTASQQGRFLLLIAGLGANAFCDTAFAFVTSNGQYWDSTQPLNCGWILGYGLVALAPLWPVPRLDRVSDELPRTLWRMMLPWFGLLPMVATTAALVVTEHTPDPVLAIPGVTLVLVLTATQVLAFRDSVASDAKLKEREVMLNNVIDHAPQGVARILPNGAIANANPKLASIFATSIESLVGSPLTSVLPTQTVELALEGFTAAQPIQTDTYESECRAKRADGSEFWLHWSMTPIRRLDGAIDYYMAMFEDITAKREAQEEAQANLDQLEKLNRLKSEFVSTVSHEFRTALVGIQGFSELIRNHDVDLAEARRMAGDINDDAVRLSRMLGQFLDLDRLDSGKVRLDLKPIQINNLIQAAAERARISTDKHQVVVCLQPALPGVMADADRITEVLANLLSNAIKYSPKGGDVVVRSRLVGLSVAVAVIDHGLGIAPEFINRIFGRYERYEGRNHAGIIGTGLGLAITRQIVEMHGGTISVESTLGAGSVFEFRIPIATAVQ